MPPPFPYSLFLPPKKRETLSFFLVEFFNLRFLPLAAVRSIQLLDVIYIITLYQYY